MTQAKSVGATAPRRPPSCNARRGFSIRGKLFSCFSLILLIGAAATVHSFYTLHSLRTQLEHQIEVASNHLDQARQITIAVANMRLAMRGITMFSLTANPVGLQNARAAFEEAARGAQKTAHDLEGSASSAEEMRSLRAISSSLDEWVEYFPGFAALSAAGKADEANRITLQKMTPVMDVIQKSAKALGEASLAKRTAAVGEFEAVLRLGAAASATLAVLLTLVAGVAFLIVSRLVRALRKIAVSVANEAYNVARASTQISEAGRQLAENASEQAASLEETSAATKEIGTTASHNRESSQAAADLVAQSGERLSTTNRSLDLMVAAMASINGSSDQVAKITKVIEEIAFQTNILALNAAVEAARAGDAGSGFAVVADEVRNLSRRCAQASQEIASLIAEAIAKSHDGASKVDTLAGAMRAITAEANQVRKLVDDVNRNSGDQAHGIEQIGHAMHQMEQVTQRTASSAEEASAAADQLESDSTALAQIVEGLTALSGAAV